MAVKIKQGAALTTLSLTPLIDVVFLLLIFFLVATRFAEEDRDMPLPLPDASEAMPVTITPKEIFINIDDQGRMFVGVQQVNAKELERMLLQAAANNPHQQATIRADKRVPLQHPVTAINLCKKANIQYMISIEAPQQ